MKINNVHVSQQEAENMIPALNYKLRHNGQIEIEVETRYFSGSRNVHAIVHVERGWDKEYNLTSGAVTNIADQDGDHDGDYDGEILTQIERIVSRLERAGRINKLFDQLIAKQQKTLESFGELRKFF